MLSTTYSNPPHLKVQELVEHHVLEGVHYQQDSIILCVMEMRADLLIALVIQIMGVAKMLECYAVSAVARGRGKKCKKIANH